MFRPRRILSGRSLTFREELGLRVFENWVLRGIFGLERDEVTRELRKLHNEELHDLYYLPNIIRIIKARRKRWVGHVARMGGEKRLMYNILCTVNTQHTSRQDAVITIR